MENTTTIIITLITALTSAGVLQLVSWWYNRREDRRKRSADADTQSAQAADILSKAAATFAADLNPRINQLEEKWEKANADLMTMSRELAASYAEIAQLKREVNDWKDKHRALQAQFDELKLAETRLREENNRLKILLGQGDML